MIKFKKLFTLVMVVVLSVMCSVTVFAAAAKDSPGHGDGPDTHTVKVTLNKQNSPEVTFTRVDDGKGDKITYVFEYKGDAVLMGWNIVADGRVLVAGVDYKVVSRTDNHIEIDFLTIEDGTKLWINAYDKKSGKLTKEDLVDDTTEPDTKPTGPSSPHTGSLALSGKVAIVCGVALLLATGTFVVINLKKKCNE